MDEFLSDAISRNRPRVILFSRSPTPSLIYHLTAFYLHRGPDFAHVPTVRGELGKGLERRFGVREGEKKLMVFKEDQDPVLVQPVSGHAVNPLNFLFCIPMWTPPVKIESSTVDPH